MCSQRKDRVESGFVVLKVPGFIEAIEAPGPVGAFMDEARNRFADDAKRFTKQISEARRLSDLTNGDLEVVFAPCEFAADGIRGHLYQCFPAQDGAFFQSLRIDVEFELDDRDAAPLEEQLRSKLSDLAAHFDRVHSRMDMPASRQADQADSSSVLSFPIACSIHDMDVEPLRIGEDWDAVLDDEAVGAIQ